MLEEPLVSGGAGEGGSCRGAVPAEPRPGARESLTGTLPSPLQMFRHTDSLFPILLQTLSDESDEVGPQ